VGQQGSHVGDGSRSPTPPEHIGLTGEVIEIHSYIKDAVIVFLPIERAFFYIDELELADPESLEPGWRRCRCGTLTSKDKCCECSR
jgi:hypothetical protein